MKKKIVCIFVCMLMCVTVGAVTATIKQNSDKNLLSTGFAKNTTPVSNVESAINEPARYLPFYAINDETDYFCSFDPSNPGVFTNIGPATPGGFIQNACFVEDVYWVIDQYGTLYNVDLATGAFTTVGSSGVSDTMGLAYDDTTGKMYMTAGTYANGKLYEIDMGTGQATLIGTMGNTGFAMISIVCDNDGQLYGVEITNYNTPGQFYSIDKTTGAATKIGTGVGFNMNYGQDAEYDKDNDILYFCAYNNDAGPEFRTIDKTAGTSTFIGNLPGQTTGFGIPYISNLPPNTPSAPIGPDTGVKATDYTFSALTTDPEGDQIYYKFNWDDGTTSDWIGPVDSGVPGSATHQWANAGTYNITAKAKDVNDRESGWSPAHMITILSTPTLEIGNITGGLFRVHAVIKNTGLVDAMHVQWSITLTGGAFIGKNASGILVDVPPGGERTVNSNFILGFGKTVITVKASHPDSVATRDQNGTILLFFIIIK
jgi:hypothetical protein